jgi:hypothetical protein
MISSIRLITKNVSTREIDYISNVNDWNSLVWIRSVTLGKKKEL